MKRTVTVLGGDRRQIHLAQLLREDGWDIRSWGLDGEGSTVPLHRALEAEMVILPLPVSREGRLYAPLTDAVLEMEDLWPRLWEDQLLLGGMIGPLARKLYLERGLTLLDYYQREEVQILNAVPTVLAVGHGSLQLPYLPVKCAGFHVQALHRSGCGNFAPLPLSDNRVKVGMGNWLPPGVFALGSDFTMSV